ncbi:FG-GAP-like repeat-containing protein, partial [Microcoleus sp. S28C3]|uniref:FG-GAP-like repeat-containing protein n=1 Tax=Microcoleus sp. S28C3 TaxID=3055414 RepID=UPI002FD4BDDD
MSTFSTATNFPVGTNPNSVVVGDFNKDGKPDIATSNGNSGNISILLGNGTGGFGTATNFNANSPGALALGDFNGDGNLDIVTLPLSGSGGEFPTYRATILLGTGTGSFGTPTQLSGDQYTKPVSVVTGDFDADGKLDLVIAKGNNVSIQFGNGAGSFTQAPANFDPGPFIPPVGGGFGGSYTNTFKSDFNVGTNPQSVVTGDFNADGKLDLAVANSGSNNVSILLGTGTGSFGDVTNFSAGTSPYSVTVGDFNSDNKSDLAVANSGSNNVSILLGTGTGSFGTPTNFNAGTSPYSVTVGDFNSDNKSDLAVANSGSNNVSILLGNGTGSFGTSTNFGAGTTPYSVAAGDFNADGKTDLATANNQSNNVSVLLNLVANFGAANYSAIEGSTDTVVNVPVTLNATPAVDVTIPIALNPSSTATPDSDYTFSPATLTFSAGTNTLTQNVAVTVKADNIPENAETAVFSFGTITDGIAGTTKETTLTIAANDAIDYAIAAGTASIAEGNSGTTPVTFTVTRSGGIDTASSVTYAIGGTATNSSDYNNIGGTSGVTSITGTVNFAAGETSKTITLDVLGDAIIEPDETITVTLSNPVAPGPTPTITAVTATTTIGNDDTAGVTINPASGLVTTEAGDSATFTVQLNSQPSANVSLGLSSSNPAEATVSSNSLSFTPANWNQPQTVTVTGVDDSAADGSKTYNIVTAATVSTDTNYSNLNPDDVSASNSDNETPGLTINPTSTIATEGGATGSYRVQLNTQPTAPVTINLATGSQLQPITALTFTATNWNVAQTVAVAAVDDNAVEGNHAGAIDHTATSSDVNYNSITISPVSVAITDNDNTPTPTPTPATPTPTPTPATPTPTPATPTPTPATPTPTPATPTP